MLLIRIRLTCGPFVDGLGGESKDPAGHCGGDTVSGQFADQREHHIGLTSREGYARVRRMISASCSRSLIRLRASRSSMDSSFAARALGPSSSSAIEPSVQGSRRNAEVLSDLSQGRFAPAGDRNHVAAKLFRKSLRHDEYPSTR